MKKIILCLVLIISVFLFVGCGKDDLSDYAGIYKLEYYKYVGDADTEKNTSSIEEITLNKDGTGKSVRDGLSIEVTWSIEENNITLTETYMGSKLYYTGTLKNNRLELYNGDKTNIFTVLKVYNKD